MIKEGMEMFLHTTKITISNVQELGKNDTKLKKHLAKESPPPQGCFSHEGDLSLLLLFYRLILSSYLSFDLAHLPMTLGVSCMSYSFDKMRKYYQSF